MKSLLEYIVKSLVDNPEKVKIHVCEGKKTTLYEIEIDKEDIGKVIGKDGATLDAINTLLSVSSVKNNRKSVLEIID
uniref:RNA-binding protein KhpA n=1 Tax=candidate division WOR-3 bacterium TaxID=2052148 RepID=A0A7C3N521_UNCW3